MENRKGQVSIFVIIAIVVVGAIVVLFAFRGNLFRNNVPAEFAPIYNTYDECIKIETTNALSLLGTQGGRIAVGEYAPGSDYAPFSSHLNFLGFQIPYWYYAAGNSVIKEQIPTLNDMEKDAELFIEDRLNDCDFAGFYAQGYFIDVGSPKASVDIQTDRVLVSVDTDLSAFIEDRSARRTTHKVEVQSKIGKFYDLAKRVYTKEKDDAFLEYYSVDVLNSYAPVDGVELQCSPKIWKTPEVVSDLKKGLSANIGAIKFKGNYYTANNVDDKYFVTDLGASVDEQVNLIYLPEEFPSKIEITPASQALMIAEPVGNQEGLGIMGFCYAPYHFVYDVSYPVLVQITNSVETFQFPMSVIIDNNLPRIANLTDLVDEQDVDICGFKEGQVNVHTYDANLNPIEADVSYNCFDSFCPLGRTAVNGINSNLDAPIPVCLNGYLIAKANGYAEKKILFSSNSETSADIILDKEYKLDVDIRVGGKTVSNTTAVVHFTSQDGSAGASAVLPDSKNVNLKEGLYDISVFVYGNSNVNIPATRKTECFDVSRGGVLGILGQTEEKCVDVEIPAVKIDYALIGGGKTTSYILQSDLEQGKLVIEASELPRPTSIEQLQYNYEVFGTLGVELNFG